MEQNQQQMTEEQNVTNSNLLQQSIALINNVHIS